MGPNPQQKDIIESLDTTINVSAGAGTGKTYTLTHRIVNCVKGIMETDPDIENPMEGILAITFTKKAAAELKARVRSALFDEAVKIGDPKLYECALNVDNAWISTIHSMASRILKENSLDFDIDPAFETISESQDSMIFDRAFDSVIKDVQNGKHPAISDLVRYGKLTASRFGGGSLEEDLKRIFNAVESMPNGLAGIKISDVRVSPTKLLVHVMDVTEKVMGLAESGKKPVSQYSNADLYFDRMDRALKVASCWLDANPNTSFDDDDFDVDGFCGALFAFPLTKNNFPSAKHECFDDFEEYRDALKHAFDQARCSLGNRDVRALLMLAESVKEKIEKIKLDGLTKLSNSDLLKVCCEKLLDPSNAKILEGYRDKFKYIMIDEFQDTDKLQMRIISALSETSFEGGVESELCNVCTVGDMQQSIYRFRGADVELAMKRKSSLEGDASRQKPLTENYRSHGDILKSVEIFFSDDAMFGENFLKLETGGRNFSCEVDSMFKARPRVVFDYINYPARGDISTAQAKAQSALNIARYFSELHEGGVMFSDMALLLGNMNDADIYARALSESEIPCIITGGSVFGKSNEALLTSDLLRYCVNPNDSDALFNILVSTLFNISDDVLMCISALGGARGLSGGFSIFVADPDSFSSTVHESMNVAQVDIEQAALAARLLSDFRKAAAYVGASRALRDLFVESGLFHRLSGFETVKPLNPEDATVAANLNKAINIIADMENASSGIAELSHGFDEHIATEKEAPGALVLEDSDFLSIMTVHASKGLEFGHVAIACLAEKYGSGSSSLQIENIGDITYVSKKSSITEGVEEDAASNAEAVDGRVCDIDVDVSDSLADMTPADLYNALKEHGRIQKLEEEKRLLYVAMTRAKETMFISHTRGANPISKGQSLNVYRGIYELCFDIASRYFGCDIADLSEDFKICQQPVSFQRRYITFEKLDDTQISELNNLLERKKSDSDSGKFVVPLMKASDKRELESFDFDRYDMFSYTSLSKDMAHPESMCGNFARSDEGACEDETDEAIDSRRDDAAQMRSLDSEKATALGSAFHRLAQLSIIRSSSKPLPRTPYFPDDARIASQARSEDLSESQTERLGKALRIWLGSNTAKDFFSHKNIEAEVSFSALVAESSRCSEECVKGLQRRVDDKHLTSFILEGEIDGLAYDSHDRAYLIDYKTGLDKGLDADQLHMKHLFQARCYAYVLLSEGFESVEAKFVLVEQADAAGEPEIVEYSFSRCDIDMLRQVIWGAYDYSVDGRS